MVLDAVPLWPAVGSLAGGAGALGLAWAIRRHRGRPGVDWFLGVFAAQATWCLSYGVALLVDDPVLRVVLEAAAWLGIVWTGIAFLGFALEYTGRSDVVRSRPFAAVVGFGLLSTVVLATNSLHGAFWTAFRFDPVFGVSTVSYAFGPWAYLVVAVESVLVASAVFLLVDTLLSYGPLYRRESAAVALSSLPPGFALVAWTLEVGPVAQLQLAPLMFVPHALLDAYAFNGAEMFDRNPTTSRAADRTAIDDLADPIVALAPDHRVVRLNSAAEALLGVDAESARDRPLSTLLDVPVTVDEDAAIAVDADGRRRTYAVSTSRLTDPNGTHVGYTVVLADVTERERRRQQLEVLNRVLRHNLRNDAGLVRGYGRLLVERLDDPELVRMADAIERRSGALTALGEKAGTVDSLLDDADPVDVDVADVVERVVAEARERGPDATVDFTVDVGEEGAEGTGGAEKKSGAGGSTARLRPDALRAVVANTVENALDHHDGAGTEREDGGAWVRVTLRREGARNDGNVGDDGNVADDENVADDGNVGDDGGPDRFVLVVEDDGPGIPDHEVSAVESGRETALEHGSGLGLWVVEWAAGTLGADVAYADRDPRGTRVTVEMPVGNEG